MDRANAQDQAWSSCLDQGRLAVIGVLMLLRWFEYAQTYHPSANGRMIPRRCAPFEDVYFETEDRCR